jgi:molybdopterin synthase sulfur carrier subunit
MARVLMFGRLADLAGWREQQIEVATVLALKAHLSGLDARLAEALNGAGVQVALDQVLLRGDAALNPASEVAFLPPMSGG